LEPIKINLATFEYEDKNLSYPVMLATGLIVLIVSILSIRIGINTQAEITEYERNVESRDRNLITRQRIIKEETRRLQPKQIESLKKEIDFVNGLIKKDAFPYDRLLEALELSVPQGVVLSDFDMSKDLNSVIIKGESDSMDRIIFFINRINESKIFKKNNLLSLSVSSKEEGVTGLESGDDHIIFELECSIADDQIWTVN